MCSWCLCSGVTPIPYYIFFFNRYIQPSPIRPEIVSGKDQGADMQAIGGTHGPTYENTRTREPREQHENNWLDKMLADVVYLADAPNQMRISTYGKT